MTAATGEPRRYRFSPLVRTGLFGGMPLTQIVVLGVGCGLSFVGILLRLFPWAIVPALVGAVVAFRRTGEMAWHELSPLRWSWWRRQRRGDTTWFRPVPLLGGAASELLPSQLRGLRLLDVAAPWAAIAGRSSGIGVVHDAATGMLTGSMRVAGDGKFSLAPAVEHDARVAGWGDALSAFCRERLVVSRVAWREWSTSEPIALDRVGESASSVAAADYEELLRRAAPRSVVHETVVSITVDPRNLPMRRNAKRGDAVENGLHVLVEELRLLSGRLEVAGLSVSPPLTCAEIAASARRRSNPFSDHEPKALVRSLSSQLGVSADAFAPMAVVEEWEHLRVDEAFHRSWWVESWPRLEVPAAWMDSLLLGTSFTRTVTVAFEPIAPSRAVRAIDEAAAALESAESAKTKHGFRVRARDRRARDEIEQREHELVAGHGDLEFTACIDLAARDLDGLWSQADDLEQAAARVGVGLRPLFGRHGTGWSVSLPLR